MQPQLKPLSQSGTCARVHPRRCGRAASAPLATQSSSACSIHRTMHTSVVAYPALNRLQSKAHWVPGGLHRWKRKAHKEKYEVSTDLCKTAQKRSFSCSKVAKSSRPEKLLSYGRSRTRWLDPRSWTSRGRGLALLNALVLLCASNLVVLKSSEDMFDPFTFALLRFSIAAVVFWPFLKDANKDVWLAGLELGLWSGLGYLLQAEGIMTTDASRASFLSAFTVIVVPLLSGLSGKGVQPVTWLSAVVAFGGVALLEQGGAPPGIGDLWNLLSALFFGVQVFRTEHYSRRLGRHAALPLMGVVMMTIVGMAALATLVAHPQQFENMARHPSLIKAALGACTLKQFVSVIYTGILSTDAVLLIEVVALRDVPSTDAAIIYTLEPVAGAALAWGFLGERWTTLGWVGAGMILASSLVAQLWNKPDGRESAA